MAYEGGGSSRFKAAAGTVMAVLVAGVVGVIVKGGTSEAIAYVTGKRLKEKMSADGAREVFE